MIVYFGGMSQLSLFGDDFMGEVTPSVSRKARVKKGAGVAKEIVGGKKVAKETSSAILDGWKPEKHYYSIGEVADLFKINNSHIRFWTKEFKLKVRTTKKGDRLYKPEDVYELRTIYHLVKERGFTLAGAKTKLKEEKIKGEETVSLKESLLILKQKLVMIRKEFD